MQDIKVNEALWASSMLPEGIVERWFIADGAIVAAGDPMAEIRIEDALHEIMAPVSGRLTIVAAANTVVEPGSLLAAAVGSGRVACCKWMCAPARARSKTLRQSRARTRQQFCRIRLPVRNSAAPGSCGAG